MTNEVSGEKTEAQKTRRPQWKHRIAFSKNRNVQVVLWPPGECEGHPTSPNVTLEEGVYNSKEERWANTRINITLDKLPNLIQDLQIAYAKALELAAEAEGVEAKPEHSIEELKDVVLRVMKPAAAYGPTKITELVKAEAEWASLDQIGEAVRLLIDDGKVVPQYIDWQTAGYRKVEK